MAALDRPSAISSSTSRSRGVSAASGSPAGCRPAAGAITSRVHRGAAAGDPADRVDELVGVEHPVLEQVADRRRCRRRAAPGRRAARRAGRAPAPAGPGTSRRAASAACRPSSVKVGGSRTSTTATSGRCSSRAGEQLRAVVDRRDDLEAVRLEQPDQAVPQEVEVLGEDNAHGTSMVTTVGPPGGLLRSSVPSNVASRRSMPRSPVPRDGSAPPLPSSVDHGPQQPVVVAQIDADAASASACLADVGQQLARPRSRRPTRPARAAGRAGRRRPSTGERAVQRERPDRVARPRSASTGGWMPRTRSRSSARAVAAASRASASSACAASGSLSSSSLGQPSFMPIATSRACAPSCRSRSIRRSSAA